VVTIQPFCLEEGSLVYNNPQDYCVTEISKDKRAFASINDRYGYQYKVSEGLSQQEARQLVDQALSALTPPDS